MDAADLDRIAAKYGIRLLLQFGSSVTGHVHPGSDVDLGVLLRAGLPSGSTLVSFTTFSVSSPIERLTWPS